MARVTGLWKRVGGAIQPVFTGGIDLLISGTNRYLNFNTTVGETGYGIRDNGGTIQVKNSAGAWSNISVGGGEANTASNLGSGEGVFSAKVGIDLRFKSLKAGTGITLTPSATEILVESTGGGGG